MPPRGVNYDTHVGERVQLSIILNVKQPIMSYLQTKICCLVLRMVLLKENLGAENRPRNKSPCVNRHPIGTHAETMQPGSAPHEPEL